MIHWFCIINKQGQTRLTKYYSIFSKNEKRNLDNSVKNILNRSKHLCNVIECHNGLMIYKRYASLIFVCFVDINDNHLLVLEIIHRYVTILDIYFGNVCELDIIFNFHKAYFILDELIIGGHMQETSAKVVLNACSRMDMLAQHGDGGKAASYRNPELLHEALKSAGLMN